MKYLIYSLLFFHSLIYITSIFDEWNFEKASYNLLKASNNYAYSHIIYNYSISDYDIILTKVINKADNSIDDNNFLEINDKINNDKYSFNVDWEDIDNIIYYNNIIHICPKGRFHPYFLNNYELNNHNMYNFPDDVNDWNLKCFLYDDLFFAIYNNQNFLYTFNSDLNGWIKLSFDFRINDLLWKEIKKVENNYYQLPGLIIYNDNNIALAKLNLIIDFSISIDVESYNNLTTGLYISKIYSDFEENNKFYFLTYNTNKIRSGFYIDDKSINLDNIENIKPNINSDLNLKDAIIYSMHIIKGTRYAYYIIEGINSMIFHGILDIITNKILFNTKETLNKFIPLSKYSMLAITKESAYEICAISAEGKCIEKCENDNIIINYEGPNYCKCPNLYFIPGYKCIHTCDLKFYINNNLNQCGLCKDLGGNKIYKLINTTECLEEKPNNTIFYDEDLSLLICDNKSYFENGTCIFNSTQVKPKDKEKEIESDEDEEDINYIVWIFIASVTVVFILISSFIFRGLWTKTVKNEIDLLNQIDTDFEPKGSSIN